VSEIEPIVVPRFIRTPQVWPVASHVLLKRIVKRHLGPLRAAEISWIFAAAVCGIDFVGTCTCFLYGPFWKAPDADTFGLAVEFATNAEWLEFPQG
jgi:hypothetical protein